MGHMPKIRRKGISRTSENIAGCSDAGGCAESFQESIILAYDLLLVWKYPNYRLSRYFRIVTLLMSIITKTLLNVKTFLQKESPNPDIFGMFRVLLIVTHVKGKLVA